MLSLIITFGVTFQVLSSAPSRLLLQGSQSTPLEIRSALVDGKCLDVSGANTGADGTNIQMWDCVGNSAQKWYYIPSTMQIKNKDGKCLDVANYGTENGANAHLWTCHDDDNQKWILSQDGTIISKFNTKCLEIADYNQQNGANVRLWSCHAQQNQLWVWFSPVSIRTCPYGSFQVGGFDADISGCGLDGCRTDIHSIEDCLANCQTNKDCKSFNWSPVGGDGPAPVCIIYGQSTPTHTFGNANRIFCQLKQMECKWDFGWLNSYDYPVDKVYQFGFISGVDSLHDDHTNDRIWKFKACGTNEFHLFTAHREQTRKTDLDQYFYRTCGDFNAGHSVIIGMKSDHHNYQNDRDFIFYCGELQDKYRVKNCYWSNGNNYVNNYDKPLHFECSNSNHAIRSIESHHHNTMNDRIFKFECCPIVNSLPSFENNIGRWEPVLCIGGCKNTIQTTVGIKAMRKEGEETSFTESYLEALTIQLETSMGFEYKALSGDTRVTTTKHLEQSTSESITRYMETSLTKWQIKSFSSTCDKDWLYQWVVNGQTEWNGDIDQLIIHSELYLCMDKPFPQCPPWYCADSTCQTCAYF